jgi:hypothetical protein
VNLLPICPFITVCQKKVSMDEYMGKCASPDKSGYLDCDEYKKLSKEQRTPLEWSRALVVPR